MINSGKSTPFNSIPLFFINKPSILSLLTFCLFAMYFFFSLPPLFFVILPSLLLSSPSFLLPCPSLSCLHHLSHLPPSLSLSFLPSLLSLSCSTPLSLVPLLPLFLPLVLSVTLFLPSNRIARFFRTLSPFLCLSFFLLPPFAIPLFTPCHCSCPFPLSSLSSSFPSTQNAFQVSFHSVCQRQENK